MNINNKITLAEIVAQAAKNLSAEELSRAMGYVEGMMAIKAMKKEKGQSMLPSKATAVNT